MKPPIMKFGGTSVEGIRLANPARIVFEIGRRCDPVVVVSAMAGFTDALIGGFKSAMSDSAAHGIGGCEFTLIVTCELSRPC